MTRARDRSGRFQRRDVAVGLSGAGWVNAETGLGGRADSGSRSVYAGRGRIGRHEVDALLRGNALARRICYRLADDATRAGFRVLGSGLAESDSDRVADYLARIGYWGALRDAIGYSRAYGGAAIVAFDGGELRDPWPGAPARVQSLLVLDRWDLWPTAYRLGARGLEHAGYTVGHAGRGVDASGVSCDASRVLPFVGVDLPIRVRDTEDGWGASALELCWESLMHLQTALAYAVRAVSGLSQGVWSVKFANLAKAGGDEASMRARIETMRAGMSSLHDVVVDLDAEKYEVLTRSISGIGEVLEHAYRAVVMDTAIPRLILLGESPGGLNSGEQSGEVRSWYDHVDAYRRSELQPIALRLLRMVLSAEDSPTGGRVPSDLAVDWLPLWQESEDVAADRALKRAQARQIDVASGVVTVDEARRDPSLVEVYPGLDPEALPIGETPSPIDALQRIREAFGGLGAAPDPTGDSGALPITTDDLPDGEDLVGLRDAAAAVGVGVGTVKGWIQSGKIRAWRPGAAYRVSMSEVRDTLRSAAVMARARAESEADAETGGG